MFFLRLFGLRSGTLLSNALQLRLQLLFVVILVVIVRFITL
jgi:hypothetical protein